MWCACMHAGAVLVIVICFMAVTSSGASEMVAVSSLFTFDVYRRYINPTVCPAVLLRAAGCTPDRDGALTCMHAWRRRMAAGW